jgi:hypothetical protein
MISTEAEILASGVISTNRGRTIDELLKIQQLSSQIFKERGNLGPHWDTHWIMILRRGLESTLITNEDEYGSEPNSIGSCISDD